MVKQFALGFLTSTIVISLCIWLARDQIIKWASMGYETIDQPALLLRNIELRKNGKVVGKIDSGTAILVKGRAKDSPMEYFSLLMGWENRGVDDKEVYRFLPKDESTLVEVVVSP
jgi:hypothetical protein